MLRAGDIEAGIQTDIFTLRLRYGMSKCTNIGSQIPSKRALRSDRICMFFVSVVLSCASKEAKGVRAGASL